MITVRSYRLYFLMSSSTLLRVSVSLDFSSKFMCVFGYFTNAFFKPKTIKRIVIINSIQK